MKRIDFETTIEAPVQCVWDVIVDLDRYPEWNTFTPRIALATRDLRVGVEFDLDCRMTDRELLRDEHEVILAVDHDRHALCMGTSRTRGRPGIKSFRWQICEPLDATRTHFVNFEEFHGPLAPIVAWLYGRKLRAAFARYGADLATRAVSQHAANGHPT